MSSERPSSPTPQDRPPSRGRRRSSSASTQRRRTGKDSEPTFFGIPKKTPENWGQGYTDKYDFKNKYPPDERNHELDDEARFWRVYLDVAAEFDADLAGEARESLDVLLVFAGLFSAVLTTFVAQTSQSLAPDPAAAPTGALLELVQLVRAIGNQTSVNDVPPSGASGAAGVDNTAVWVNGLWFISLTLSLSTALLAVLAKQWIHQYMLTVSGSSRERCHIRQFRYDGLLKWRFQAIIGLLPIPLHISLIVFLVGLVIFLIPLHVGIAGTVGALSFVLVGLYFATIILPLVYVECPFRTPFSDIVYHLRLLAAAVWRWILRRGQGVRAVPTTLRELERRNALIDHANKDRKNNNMIWKSISWLYYSTSNLSAKDISCQSIGSLVHLQNGEVVGLLNEKPVLLEVLDGVVHLLENKLEGTKDHIEKEFMLSNTFAAGSYYTHTPSNPGLDLLDLLFGDLPIFAGFIHVTLAPQHNVNNPSTNPSILQFLLDANYLLTECDMEILSEPAINRLVELWEMICSCRFGSSRAEEKMVAAAIHGLIEKLPLNTDSLEPSPLVAPLLDGLLSALLYCGYHLFSMEAIPASNIKILQIAAHRDPFHGLVHIGITHNVPESYTLFIEGIPETSDFPPLLRTHQSAWKISLILFRLAKMCNVQNTEGKIPASTVQQCITWISNRERFPQLVLAAGMGDASHGFAGDFAESVLRIQPPLDPWYREKMREMGVLPKYLRLKDENEPTPPPGNSTTQEQSTPNAPLVSVRIPWHRRLRQTVFGVRVPVAQASDTRAEEGLSAAVGQATEMQAIHACDNQDASNTGAQDDAGGTQDARESETHALEDPSASTPVTEMDAGTAPGLNRAQSDAGAGEVQDSTFVDSSAGAQGTVHGRTADTEMGSVQSDADAEEKVRESAMEFCASASVAETALEDARAQGHVDTEVEERVVAGGSEYGVERDVEDAEFKVFGRILFEM